MGRNISVLLIILIALFGAIAGNNYQPELSDRDGIPYPAVTSSALPIGFSPNIPTISLFKDYGLASRISISNSEHKDVPLSNRFISDFLFQNSPQPCWLSLSQSQDQSLTINRISSDNKSSRHASVHKLIRHYRQSDIRMPAICSDNLRESSPPGFFLLI
jgi:hypothetical protein